MKPTIIRKMGSLKEIESAILLVNQNTEKPLQIQKDSVGKHYGAMRDASRLQLLSTWARKSPESYLQFHHANNPDSVISELCAYAPGITVLRLCKGIQVGEKTILRRIALRAAANKMESTDSGRFSNIIKGRSIDLTSVSGMRLQYLRPLFFERDPSSVKHKAGMHVFLKSLFDQINQGDKELMPLDFISACSIFTSELFRNTQEHAIRDHKGEPYEAHVEGLIASWNSMRDDVYASDFSTNENLQKYWERESILTDTKPHKSLRCFQLSFFDSGPGFASRESGQLTQDMSLELERKKLISCLHRNKTTKKQPGAGLGLPGVLAELRSIGGLLRIRSGRQCIFNSFSQGSDEDLFEFDDWTSEPLGNVEGAVISLIVPLRCK